MNFSGITPGAKYYGERHPAEFNHPSMKFYQACNVYSSFFPITEAIRNST